MFSPDVLTVKVCCSSVYPAGNFFTLQGWSTGLWKPDKIFLHYTRQSGVATFGFYPKAHFEQPVPVKPNDYVPETFESLIFTRSIF